MDKIITKKDVDYVAKLARIHIPEKEKGKYESQLERLLEYVSQLKKLDTQNVKPTAHPHDLSNVWREDKAISFENVDDIYLHLDRDKIMIFNISFLKLLT